MASAIINVMGRYAFLHKFLTVLTLEIWERVFQSISLSCISILLLLLLLKFYQQA